MGKAVELSYLFLTFSSDMTMPWIKSLFKRYESKTKEANLVIVGPAKLA